MSRKNVVFKGLERLKVNNNQVYIGDLGEDATRRELEEAFDKFGRVRNVWIAKRPPGGWTICFCDQDT